MTYLGTADEVDAVIDIVVNVADVSLRSEAIISGDESEVVLFHAFPHVAWYFISRSLEKSSEAMEIQQNCDILRILRQSDGELDLEIADYLVDNVLARHV